MLGFLQITSSSYYQLMAGLLEITIKCITYYGSSNILLQITPHLGVITSYVKKLLRTVAGITICSFITYYLVANGLPGS